MNNNNNVNGKSSSTKIINISSPKPQHNHKSPHGNHHHHGKKGGKPIGFSIVEPGKNNNNHHNKNNNQKKANEQQFSLQTGIVQKTVKKESPLAGLLASITVEKDDNLLDNIHDDESSDESDVDDLEDDDSLLLSISTMKTGSGVSTPNGGESSENSEDEISVSSDMESDTGVSSSETEESKSGMTHSVSLNDLIPLSSSHVETVKISTSISLEDFKITHLIGKGGFGKVHHVIHKGSGKVHALKTLKKNHIIQKKSVLNTIAEKDILKRIEHPFIVKLHYAFQTEKNLYLVMDFINGGQLFYHLEKEKIFTEDQVRFYIAELVLAIEHLHDLNIIHRDLKPENLLLDSKGHCVLTDFGLAKEEITDDSCGSICGTFEYMSPEIVQGAKYGKAVDWWSIGILMYDMLVGKPPFESKNRAILQEKIIKDKQKYPAHISSSAKSLINGLLHKDPKLRLGSKNGAKDVKKHAFFKSIQWRKLELKELVAPFIPKTKDSEHDLSNFDSALLKEPIKESYSASPSLSASQQAVFDGFSFVRTSVLNLNQ